MPAQDRYVPYQDQRALVAGPTYRGLVQARSKHPQATHFTVTIKQLGRVGEPVTTIDQTRWQAITLPNRSTAFVELQSADQFIRLPTNEEPQ